MVCNVVTLDDIKYTTNKGEEKTIKAGEPKVLGASAAAIRYGLTIGSPTLVTIGKSDQPTKGGQFPWELRTPSPEKVQEARVKLSDVELPTLVDTKSSRDSNQHETPEGPQGGGLPW